MFESAFGTDFGLSNFPALKESATFRVLCNAPSGWYFNFADCGDRRGQNGDITLAWFATKTGNQSYHALEKTGFDLWGRCQECERWTLLTKNNYGHSTITINDELHRSEGLVTITDFKEGDEPTAMLDMSPTLGNQVKSASRRFTKDSPTSLLIEDEIVTSEKTELITWQLITQADVEIVEGGAILRQDGKTLKLENLSHPKLMASVISLDPAPLKLDRQIEGLKRIEFRYPAYIFDNNKASIIVRLSGE